MICGHIHQPEIRKIDTEKGSVLYLNSGDWVENLTSLEYHNGEWTIYKYEPELDAEPDFTDIIDSQDLNDMLNIKTLLESIKNDG